MALWLKRSTQTVVPFGPFLDKTDGVTLETGLVSAIDNATTGLRISKNGGAYAARATTIVATTYDSMGEYLVTLKTGDTDTLGRLRIIFEESATTLPVWADFMIVPANVWDSLFGTDKLDVSVVQWLGTAAQEGSAGVPSVDLQEIGGVAQSATDLKDFADAGYDPATNKVQGVVLCDTVTANTDNHALILSTTVNFVTTQQDFSLVAGSVDADAYNGCLIIIEDSATATQKCQGLISDYFTTDRTVNLQWDPGVFTIGPGDKVYIYGDVGAKVSTLADKIVIDSGGRVASNVMAISDDTVAATNLESDYDGTGYTKANSVLGTVTTNADMRGTNNAALASVVGALADAAAAGDPTSADTLMQYVKQLINILAGTAGIATMPAAAAPANNVSIAEMLRITYDKALSLDGTKIPDTISLAAINAEVDTALATTTYAEPTGVPAATATLKDKIGWLAMQARNKIEQTATTQTVRADDTTTAVATAAVADDGTTASRAEFV